MSVTVHAQSEFPCPQCGGVLQVTSTEHDGETVGFDHCQQCLTGWPFTSHPFDLHTAVAPSGRLVHRALIGATALPADPTTDGCASCRHWAAHDIDAHFEWPDRTVDRRARWGTCEREFQPAPPMFTNDASRYFSALRTRADHGCRAHEERTEG